MSRVVVYHDNCYDGFGAAFVCWLKWGDQATYLPMQYHDNLKQLVESHDEVYLVDFSCSREVLLELRETKRVIVYDHHKTAQQELIGLDDCVFDMSRSGVMITWDELFPNEQAPWLIQYIQDRDLWKWELPESRVISKGLSLEVFDFIVWQSLIGEEMKSVVHSQGIVVEKYSQQLIQRALKSLIWVEFDNHRIPVINSNVLISEISERMLLDNPTAPFSLVWYTTDQGVGYSLRSRVDGDFDVSEIAKKYGGGGHKTAAGFFKRGVINSFPIEVS